MNPQTNYYGALGWLVGRSFCGSLICVSIVCVHVSVNMFLVPTLFSVDVFSCVVCCKMLDPKP